MEATQLSMIKSIWQRRLLLVLCIILAIEFIPGGAFKFVSGETFFGPPYSVKFVNWGYPAWFRFVVGAGEIFGAILLLLPRYRFYGAALLFIILTGAVITHFVNVSSVGERTSSQIHFVLTGIVAWFLRPVDWRRARLKTE